MIVGVSYNNITLESDSNTARLGELPFHHTKFPKFAVIYHFLPFDLGFGRKTRARRHQLSS